MEEEDQEEEEKEKGVVCDVSCVCHSSKPCAH